MPNSDTFSAQNGAYTTSYFNTSGVLTSMSNGFARLNEYTVKRTSVNTPGFKFNKKRPNWALPMNDYYAYRIVRWCPRGNMIQKSKDPRTNPSKIVYSGCLDGVSFTDSRQDRSIDAAEKASVDGIARNKLLLKIKDQKVNLAQAFAERKMTAATIANSATRMADALVNLRKGNFLDAASALGIKVSKRANARFKKGFRKSQSEATANGWLELQYGWKPLLNDIFGAAELLALSNAKIVRGRVSAQHSVQRQFEIKSSSDRIPKVEFVHVEYVRKYVCYFSASNEVLNALSRMGITNPALIAWELLPYSFVADWFIPIGNWISSFDATLGLDFEKGSVTTFRRTFTNQVWAGKSTADPFDTFEGYGIAKCEYVEVTRSKLTTFPGNSLPQFKNPVSFDHAANAIALLVQLFKK